MMVYMDNAATSRPKPEATYQAMDMFMRHIGANPGRSGHSLSIKAGRCIYETREAVAQLLGVENPLRIIFTSGATEALNVVVNGILQPGDHVITSGMEHNSVMRPLRHVESKGVDLAVVPCSPAGSLNPEDVERAVRQNTRLIISNHASNVTGTILPIAEVGEIARRRGVLFCVDAAQTAGAYPLNVEEARIDLLVFAGHKSLFGPPGTGGIYVREGVEELLPPLTRGGTGSISEHEQQPTFLPDKYESGTPNTVGLAGLGAGVRFVLSQGVSRIREKEEKLAQLLIKGLSSIPGVTLYGVKDAREQIAVLSFNVSHVSPSEIAMMLEEKYHILCRPGLHCAPSVHKTIGTFPRGTVRLSPGYFNTEEEVYLVIQAVSRMSKGLARAADIGCLEEGKCCFLKQGTGNTFAWHFSTPLAGHCGRRNCVGSKI
jgi:cysteine desulfurase family protein